MVTKRNKNFSYDRGENLLTNVLKKCNFYILFKLIDHEIKSVLWCKKFSSMAEGESFDIGKDVREWEGRGII